MIKRTIDINEQSYLHLEKKQLLVDRRGETIASIPVEDIGVLILTHPAITVSQALIIACQQNNVAMVFCNQQHLPYSVLLPISDGNSLHTRVLREQLAVSRPIRKRLWQQVVRQKILQQAETLESIDISCKRLYRLAETVKSGDTANHEAQAAQVYWRRLMGEDFRRDKDAEGINSLLNYGYAVIRAMVARALVASGLHPAIGLQHSNQYNGLCLADDLMEPFRPWVDLVVYRLAKQQGQVEVNKITKEALLGLLSDSVIWKGKTLPLMVASHSLAASLKSVMNGQRKSIEYPKRMFEACG